MVIDSFDTPSERSGALLQNVCCWESARSRARLRYGIPRGERAALGEHEDGQARLRDVPFPPAPVRLLPIEDAEGERARTGGFHDVEV